MEALLRSLDSLLALVSRGDGGSFVIDPEFKQALKQAQSSVGRWRGGAWKSERIRFVTDSVMSSVLGALYIKKTRVTEAALPLLQRMIHNNCIQYTTSIVLYRANGSSSVLSCGAAMFEALGDVLARITDAGLQLTSVEILHDLVSDDSFPSFTGKCVTRCIQTCCRVALLGASEGARGISRDLLPLCVLRVTRTFLESAPTDSRSCTFTSLTPLDDYVHDVEPDSKHLPISVENNTDPFVEASLGETTGDERAAQSLSHNSECELFAETTFSSFDYFRSTLNGQIIGSALSSMKMGRFPDAMKDLLLLIKHTCSLGARTVSGSGSTGEGGPEARARQLALDMLEAVFQALPMANCCAEHHCATWLSLVITATKYDLTRCLARNLTAVAPASFFASAVRIISLLLQKCHYHLARELHTVLAVMLFPLALSRYSSFSQKHAVVDMVRELLSVPHLCVSLFINYDCNPTFDAGGKYGGMLELMVNFVAEMTFTHLIEPDWLSDDQQQLLRSGCASAIHNLVHSLQRWIAEDPDDYSHQQTREVVGQVLSRLPGDTVSDNRWYDVYRNYSERDVKDGHRVSERVTGNNMPVSPIVTDESLFEQQGVERRWSVGYHWKHIHYLLHSKRTAQLAVGLINKGQWRQAMSFLKERDYIPAEGEEGWSAFALFLKTYEGVERGALCGIFERVLKDKDCDRILREYLQHFSYRNVPIDIALRDTTCEFMSWDRPTFEAQVWVVIQQRFGEVYAAQNPRSISPDDANAMAGVLLFLHTSLHNANVRSSRMTMKDFVRNGNECVAVPFPEDVMCEMYTRVARSKWELDRFQRTPRQAEMEFSSPGLARMLDIYNQQRQQHVLSSEQLAPADAVGQTVDAAGLSHSGSGTRDASLENFVGSSGHSDSSLLDASMLPYTEELETFKSREPYHQRYAELALQCLQRLEREHRVLCGDRGGVQPYAIPHYAQHVRPMLLSLYPQIAATIYKGLRVLEVQPILRLLHDTYSMLDDLVAAFAVNLTGMHVAVEKRIQYYMLRGGTRHLPPPTRATFALPLMNLV
ncbi:hypothetical protein, conserved [Trypanosoma brucei brucei TREU927]|uniref:SEC7 domain-containing protein n=1 Tax=Trypanosoma brucei brucei (strain 927/4 GUTat10.1) TaxID=185431 RepID=Q381I9_TRYB2|nr:hypothetical protein, conserved [Trypanosoma brucei brucei TREU927]EAN80542.1 hypothetical protein, conserved [Trypanosoma brucei brucei TREU927]